MSEHTKEPWCVGNTTHENGEFIETAIMALEGRAAVAVCLDFGFNNLGMRESNARRIVACVNACAGIDTAYLESPDNLATYARRMAVQRDELLYFKNTITNASPLLERCLNAEQQRDDLLAALKALEDACDKRVSCLSREAYLVAERCKGMKDALNALDDARHLARATISKVESEK